MRLLTAKRDTYLKTKAVASSALSSDEKMLIKAGTVMVVNKRLDGTPNHTYFEFANSAGDYWIFDDHWDIVKLLPARDLKAAQSDINWNDMSAKVSKYFTVGEVCNNETRRIPKNPDTIRRILRLAQEADKVREAWGSGIIVTSWHRPLAVNRAIGSGDRSRHVQGDAMDIYPSNGKIWEFQKWLDANWYGALGYGAKKGFVHIDMRNMKGFKTGGIKSVRWNY